ncbi:MAG: TetM/TetW/TetO/TetS family tetracycline resistance ribosomal protection protein [Bacteroidales bacterium]|nr:TetM/TetW/TetO/TetS family tetracycline resistance ribosomal protection protein [Bacteroidales bacterium]
MKTPINIAFLAHVDAGKTTVTEQILFQTGVLKSAGNVDKGTTLSDFLEVEKERGISVISSHVSTEYCDVKINIVDTPGHADFISEVERSLLAVDIVVLLISAPDGVQAQTRVLWGTLDRLNIPRIILVNKIERSGVVLNDVLSEIKQELSSNIIPIQEVLDAEKFEVNYLRDYIKSSFQQKDHIVECLAEYDDKILDSYLSSSPVGNELLQNVYQKQFMKANIFPVLFAVAKNGFGIQGLLNEIVSHARSENVQNELSAVVFKIIHHEKYGKLAYVRLFSGSLTPKEMIFNKTRNLEKKLNQIKTIFSNKYIDLPKAKAGEIVALAGLTEVEVGDVLGHLPLNRKLDFNTTPILTVEVKPITQQDYIQLAEVLAILDMEDPLLQFIWFKEEKEFHLKINGWIQIEILQQILKQRFDIDTDFQMPTVIYKETPAKTSIGYEEYTMPKPCWAVVKFEIKPIKGGSGVVFKSQVGVNDILLKYQKEVERTMSKALEQGVKGWEVTDVEITLIGGEDHNVHSRAGDFVIATPMAIMNGLKESGTDILEPIMKFVLYGTDDILGQVSSDMHKMRGVFEQPVFDGDKFKMEGRVPFATAMEYPVQLASRSGGRASIQMQFDGYQKVEDEFAVIREFKGISPLDRAKYILKARKALS